jgi:nitroreductase
MNSYEATHAVPADVLSGIMDSRWSCRGFEDRAVPTADIERLLEMAQRAPSWSNIQPWEVTVVTGGRLERLRADLVEYAKEADVKPDLPFPGKYGGVYQERRRECGWQLYDAVGVAKGDRVASMAQAMENFRFFGAPAMALVTTEGDLGPYAVLDCGVYLGYFVLAAQSLGLGAIAQASVAGHSDFFRRELEVPANRQILAGVSFGYPDDSHATAGFRTTRANIADVARFVH